MRRWADHFGVRIEEFEMRSRNLGFTRRMTITAAGPGDALESFWEELDSLFKARVSFWDLLGP